MAREQVHDRRVDVRPRARFVATYHLDRDDLDASIPSEPPPVTKTTLCSVRPMTRMSAAPWTTISARHQITALDP
ncbi:hypothetical protein AR457_38360 [Streptomyces agglomeratus]|nr:hypothetical protein AR457_38360 [Streptomyces agglomeratus]